MPTQSGGHGTEAMLRVRKTRRRNAIHPEFFTLAGIAVSPEK
jgi:hypothetical protein